MEQALKGGMAGVPIDNNLKEPYEQGFYYQNSLFSVAPRTKAKVLGAVGENRFAPPPRGTAAFIHTHPSRWAEAAPGPGDWGHEMPVFGIHPDRIWVIYPGARREKQLWP